MSKYDPQVHHRRSIRLKGYDYASPGAYFVTICVRQGECVLGKIVDGQMELSDFGRIAAESWQWLAEQYPYVTLDAWVVMPNHLHGIIIINDDPPCRGGSQGGGGLQGRGGSRTAPTPAPTGHKPLGRLIGAFKTVSTKRINQMRDTPGQPFWQRNYYEHIIRNPTAHERIRQYIATNPARWTDDQLHPDAPPNPFNRG
jgi:putative transposase